MGDIRRRKTRRGPLWYLFLVATATVLSVGIWHGGGPAWIVAAIFSMCCGLLELVAPRANFGLRPAAAMHMTAGVGFVLAFGLLKPMPMFLGFGVTYLVFAFWIGVLASRVAIAFDLILGTLCLVVIVLVLGDAFAIRDALLRDFLSEPRIRRMIAALGAGELVYLTLLVGGLIETRRNPHRLDYVNYRYVMSRGEAENNVGLYEDFLERNRLDRR